MNGQLNGPWDVIEICRLVFPLLHVLKGGGNQHPGPLIARAWTTFPSLSMTASISTMPSGIIASHNRPPIFPRMFHLAAEDRAHRGRGDFLALVGGKYEVS